MPHHVTLVYGMDWTSSMTSRDAYMCLKGHFSVVVLVIPPTRHCKHSKRSPVLFFVWGSPDRKNNMSSSDISKGRPEEHPRAQETKREPQTSGSATKSAHRQGRGDVREAGGQGGVRGAGREGGQPFIPKCSMMLLRTTKYERFAKRLTSGMCSLSFTRFVAVHK